MDVYGCLADKTMIKCFEIYHQDKKELKTNCLNNKYYTQLRINKETTVKSTITNVIRNTYSSVVTSIKAITIK